MHSFYGAAINEDHGQGPNMYFYIIFTLSKTVFCKRFVIICGPVPGQVTCLSDMTGDGASPPFCFFCAVVFD